MRPLIALALLASTALPAGAATITAAFAANFTAPAEALAEAFAAETGHEIRLSFGATGGLYTQIAQGAPFDLFLAADDVRPALAIAEGLGVEGSVFTYAIGRLALYAPEAEAADETLLSSSFTRLAVADPQAAPYGRAAVETLAALGLGEALADRLVTGQTIAQALQFVKTGNAELGFVALSQVIAEPSATYWLVPDTLHSPIRQDAVLLSDSAEPEAASQFLAFLRSDAGRAIIEAFGYGVD
ncbi:molybdate ABC transporter substrate-binding protein [Arsenicitalea aurantiaca]|uniref:Molybdate ABC transporter substrate-binding protein n=1 Tax=Arsenicitalea aurantiaca TaxID=1783274 RepID=A0A433XK66_9HYPH|nr:molybdate ABC transporter substrate-binding protein [Arsenicitalea aurantiaca]RUT34453.1 molybdate ABC transporter substrate-binding protein [Arsenicitalea aurantiaca]